MLSFWVWFAVCITPTCSTAGMPDVSAYRFLSYVSCRTSLDFYLDDHDLPDGVDLRCIRKDTFR